MSPPKENLEFALVGAEIPFRLKKEGVDRLFFAKEGVKITYHTYHNGTSNFVPYGQLHDNSEITQSEVNDILGLRKRGLEKRKNSSFLSWTTS